MKNYYELLEVARDASASRIKQAFRQLIAQYHPDKVHHLGVEFRELAERRSAELTIAYKTLVDPLQRESYDRLLACQGPRGSSPGPQRAEPEDGPAGAPACPAADVGESRRTSSSSPWGEAPSTDARPTAESLRQGRDALLKRAALDRADHVLRQALPGSDRFPVPGFDLGYVARRRLFAASAPSCVLARFVPRLDRETLDRSQRLAMRASTIRKTPVWVFLLCGAAPRGDELAAMVGASRAPEGSKRTVTIVPVDLRDWRPWIPPEAEHGVQSLAARLHAGL